jgi:integrase
MTPYRRHLKACPHANKGTAWQRCNCPVWVYAGRIDGKPVRYSLDTNNWDRALMKIAEGLARPAHAGATLTDAASTYLADCEARHLAAATITDYRALLALLSAHLPGAEVDAIMPAHITSFRATRKISASTARKELIALRAFFGFCRRNRWCEDNPAAEVRMPENDTAPTMPYTQAEVTALLAACERYGQSAAHRDRARALVLLLLYSGLRIGDVMMMRRDRIDWRSGRLILRTQKTGVRVSVKLPSHVIAALDRLPKGEYLFWRGGRGSTAQSTARVTLHRLAKLAGVDDVRPHRFRDTFSCRLLEKGVDIRRVQHLLGHASLRTTERHYAPFVAEHQRLLDEATDMLDFTDTAATVTLMPRAQH